MERQETIIFWINEKSTCKVVFIVNENSYLLIRNKKWTFDNLYNINKNKQTSLEIDSARKLWDKLVSQHDFMPIKNKNEY